MQILITWLVYTLAILITGALLPGVSVVTFGSAFVAALVLGILNVFIKPLLIILTLPVNILTLGLFTFVINALIILMVSRMVDGFNVDGFLPALLFALVLAVVSSVLLNIFR